MRRTTFPGRPVVPARPARSGGDAARAATASARSSPHPDPDVEDSVLSGRGEGDGLNQPVSPGPGSGRQVALNLPVYGLVVPVIEHHDSEIAVADRGGVG